MISGNEPVEENYDSLEPGLRGENQYISTLNIHGHEDKLQKAQDMIYKSYDYAQEAIENLREKRQSDFIPLDKEPEKEKFLVPLYAITAFFGAVMIIGPFLVSKGPNRGIIQACILLSAFCMWIFWFTIYFGQMNPLMGPRLDNTTVAWIAYKLGNPLTPPSAPGTSETPPENPPESPPESPPEPEERVLKLHLI